MSGNLGVKEKKFSCDRCDKNFVHKKTLNRHVRNDHLVGKPCVCFHCLSHFNDKYVLRKHIIGVHEKKFHAVKCPLCDFKEPRSLMPQHLEKTHNIRVDLDLYEFQYMSDFENWKRFIESDTVARFVVDQRFRKKGSVTKTIYVCHRSGYFKPRGRNIRRLKAQGTNKIMGHCPARIVSELSPDGRVSVWFYKTHVGHENDIDKILTKKEKLGAAKVFSETEISYYGPASPAQIEPQPVVLSLIGPAELVPTVSLDTQKQLLLDDFVKLVAMLNTETQIWEMKKIIADKMEQIQSFTPQNYIE